MGGGDWFELLQDLQSDGPELQTLLRSTDQALLPNPDPDPNSNLTRSPNPNPNPDPHQASEYKPRIGKNSVGGRQYEKKDAPVVEDEDEDEDEDETDDADRGEVT